MVGLKSKSTQHRLPDWKTVQYEGITVYYLKELDGGALDFGEEAFVKTVGNMFGSVGTACEFCSGPGFIGFSLLARGLCKKLCLVDINPDAITCCKKTIRENGLENEVTTYLSDGLAKVPPSEKWDLVVSNPPHFDGTRKMYENDIIAIDPDWTIHQKFYKNIPRLLSNNGSVLFLENITGAPESMWKGMIIKNGLKFKKTFWEKQPPATMLKRTLTAISLLSWGSITRFIRACIRQRDSNFLLQRAYPYYFVWSTKSA